MARIYIASSWRNQYQPEVVKQLDAAGHFCYDFRNPPNKAGFKWSNIEPGWESLSRERYVELLTTSDEAAHGYTADYRAMQWADTCVLVLPAGPSSHLEAGYFNGANKHLIIYMPQQQEPDLMYLMASTICLSMDSLLLSLEDRR